MDVIQEANPKIIPVLMHSFIEDGSFTKKIIAKELFTIMINTPQDIIVIVLKEVQDIRGFAIAWTDSEKDYVWLAQARYKPGCDRKHGIKAMTMIKKWAIEEHNKHEIRFETERNPKAIERVWGFKIHAYVMKETF